MRKNANLKWQECTDLGYRRGARNNLGQTIQPDAVRSARADDRRNNNSHDSVVEKSEAVGHPT